MWNTPLGASIPEGKYEADRECPCCKSMRPDSERFDHGYCKRCGETMCTSCERTKCAEPGCTVMLCPECTWCFSIEDDSYCQAHFKGAIDRWSTEGPWEWEPETERARRMA